MKLFLFLYFYVCFVWGEEKVTKRKGYIAPRIISAHSGYYEALSQKRPDRPEINDVPTPDFFPGFIFGCVIMAGFTGIIVGLCLRIETIRRCECLSDVTSCIALTDDGDKVDADSPLKEPLKKKGANIHNPYPNFKAPDGLPGGLMMVSESPRLNRKNSMRSLSSFRTFKSWGGIGKIHLSKNRSLSKGDIQRAGSVTGSIVKSTVSSKKSSIKRQRVMSIKDEDRHSIHSSRSNGTMRSRDGNWTSHSCQQTCIKSPYTAQRVSNASLIPRTLGSVINSPALSRRGSAEKVAVLNPYEAITVTPQSTFQKQATVNEAIVY